MSREDPTRRFFSTTEAARYCSVSNDSVLKWIHAGRLRAFATPGGHYRISAEDFREFLVRHDIAVDELFFASDRQQRTVLIVSDVSASRMALERTLRRAAPELSICTAADEFEAGVAIGRERPALVVIDLMATGLDGPGLCRSIRSRSETAHSRILALVADRTGVPADRLRAAGADCLLARRWRADRLVDEVRRLLVTVGPRRAGGRS